MKLAPLLRLAVKAIVGVSLSARQQVQQVNPRLPTSGGRGESDMRLHLFGSSSWLVWPCCSGFVCMYIKEVIGS